MVLAREEFGPAVKLQPIVTTFARQSNHLVMISLIDNSGKLQVITTTDDHPFWVVERGEYFKPEDLRRGMTMIGPNEERQAVVNVFREDHPESVPVYNFCVNEFKTYFVSQSSDNLPVLVHNTDGKDCAKAAATIAKSVEKAAPRNFLGADDFASLPKSGRIDPKTIRFSQDSIASEFKGGAGAVEDLAAKFKAGQVDPLTIPPIRIVVKDRKVFTLDNRRLSAFEEAGIEIPFERLDSIPLKELDKFTTINDGVEIIIRRKPQ